MLVVGTRPPRLLPDYMDRMQLTAPACEAPVERKPSDLLTIDWRPCTSQEKTEFEVTLDRDQQFAGGLAFRIIGSRNSGIFVDQVEEKSVQSGYLRQGDKIISCGERRLSGLTPEQAAGILRCSVQRTGQIRIRVERDERGEDLIIRRRSMTCVALEEERSWQEVVAGRFKQPPDCPFKQVAPVPLAPPTMPKSVSAQSFESRKRTYRVVASRSTAFLHLTTDEEKEELLTPRPTARHQRLTRSFYSFDTSDINERSVCTVCQKKTRLVTLHVISHKCMETARRLIPNSHSDGAFSANYRLL